MATMRTATYDRYGGPDVLREDLVDAPIHVPGEVLVKVHAASVNGYDVVVRSGALRVITGRKFPKHTGLDFAGEVALPAHAAPQFKPGDRVWGVMPLHQLGSAAEFVCVAPGQLSHSPPGLEPAEAAALPVVGVTAIIAVRDIGKLQHGQRLLVRGASGGVGSVAVQLGRAFGSHVTALASAANLDFVRELGADEAFDYAVTGSGDLGTFDVIVDTVGSDAGAWRRRLAVGGRMAAIVPDPRHPLRSMAYFAVSRIYGARRVRFFSAKPDTRLLTDLAALVSSGVIKPHIGDVYPLSRIADAHRAMEAGGQRGKQVIRIVTTHSPYACSGGLHNSFSGQRGP